MSFSHHRRYQDIINGSQSNEEKYKEFKDFLHRKGYGDREQELKFVSDFFSDLLRGQHDLFEIQWQQYQDYNDNWLYFDIHELKLNQYLKVSFTGFDFAQPDVFTRYDYYRTDRQEKLSDWPTFHQSTQEKHLYLRPYTDKILIFLRALYDYYGRYYFIYLFGRRANVKITNEGILIDNENIEYEEGSGHDKIFLFDAD